MKGVSAILLQVSVWLDVVFTTVFVVAVLGLAAHGIGNTLVGRFKKRFVDWEWPVHEGPPIPFLPKFMHIQHLVCMFILGITGMYIRFPFFDGGRTVMRTIHYVAMVIVTFNLIWRLWYAFGSRQRDYKEFALGRKDLASLPGVIMYYLFLRPSKPHVAKYNIMQKGTYLIFPLLLILQAITGFSLLTQQFVFGYSPRELLLGWSIAPLVGGLALAGAWMHLVHYTLNWLFIILTTVHVYMALSENYAGFLDFFGLVPYENQRGHLGPAESHDDGHGEDSPEASELTDAAAVAPSPAFAEGRE